MLKLLVLLLSFTSAYAVDYSVSGFFGYTQWNSTVPTNFNNTPYDLGVLLNTKLADDIEFNSLIRYSGEENFEESLTFGFLSKHFNVGGLPFELQGGKFKYDFGLHGGDLSNPQLRPTMLPAQSIYWTPLRFTIRSAYGFRILTQVDNFELSASIGQSSTHNKQEEVFAWLNVPYRYLPFKEDLDMDGYFANTGYTYLKYSDDNNLFKIGLGFLDMNDYISGQYITIGYGLNVDDFSFEAESLIVKPTHKSANIEFSDFDELSKGYSVTLGYQITDSIKSYFNFNSYDRKSKTLPFFNIEKNTYYDYSVGLKYMLNSNIMLRGEIHKSNGAAVLTNEESLYLDGYDDYYTTAFNFTYFF